MGVRPGGGEPAPESTGRGPGLGDWETERNALPCPTRAQACTGGGRYSAKGAPSTREGLPGPETPDLRPTSHLLCLFFGPALLSTSCLGFWFCSIFIPICHSPAVPGSAHTPSHSLQSLLGGGGQTGTSRPGVCGDDSWGLRVVPHALWFFSPSALT